MSTGTGREERAQAFSAACFTYLVHDPEELARFMTVAGYDPDSLRKALGTSALEFGMLDYFATNEPLLLAMCANSSIDPQNFMSTWRHLNRQD